MAAPPPLAPLARALLAERARIQAVVAQLKLAAHPLLAAAQRGQHLRPAVGQTQTFREFSPYAAGDDLRHLDWRTYARTGQRQVKRFAVEGHQRLLLWLDNSPSMHFGEGSQHKLLCAATVALALAQLACRQEDRVGLTLTHACRQAATKDMPGGLFRVALPPTAGQAGLEQVAWGLAQAVAAPPADPLPPDVPPHRPLHVVVLTDGLQGPLSAQAAPPQHVPTPDVPTALAAALTRLRRAGHAVTLVHVLSPAERAFAFAGTHRFAATATGNAEAVDCAHARAGYLANLAHFERRLVALCAAARTQIVPLTAGASLYRTLSQILAARSRAGGMLH